jgi:hypothetical protein
MKDNVKQTDWGLEITWADQDEYCAKILLFEKTLVKTPFVFHQEIKKTFFVNAGNFKFRWIDTKDGKVYEQFLEEGAVYTVNCLTPWSLESQIAGGSVMQVSNSNDTNDNHIVLGG